MKLLLDTHTFLFAFAEPEKLKPRLRKLLVDPAVERWVSVITFWEIAIKVRAGRLELPSDPEYHEASLTQVNAKLLPIDFSHTMALFDLPLRHKDPFDRMLIAQAAAEGMTLATRDRLFASYDVPTIW